MSARGKRVEPSPGFWFNLSYDTIDVTSMYGSWEKDPYWSWRDPHGHVHSWNVPFPTMHQIEVPDSYYRDADGEEWGPDYEFRCLFCNAVVDMKHAYVYEPPSSVRQTVAGLPTMTFGWSVRSDGREEINVAEFVGSREQADFFMAEIRATKGKPPLDAIQKLIDDGAVIVQATTRAG
jgi:hypothetical protein